MTHPPRRVIIRPLKQPRTAAALEQKEAALRQQEEAIELEQAASNSLLDTVEELQQKVLEGAKEVAAAKEVIEEAKEVAAAKEVATAASWDRAFAAS